MTEPSSDRDTVRLTALAADLRDAHERMQYLTHGEVERHTEVLASMIRDTLGGSLADWHFQPVPRGGLIVTGMLSYLLELAPGQLPPKPADGRHVVIVDDVALTGARLIEVIDNCSAPSIVVALIAAHPALRAAVEAIPRVVACLSAVDLTGAIDRLSDGEAEEYQREWAERAGGNRLWMGGPSTMAFPWAEADHMIALDGGVEHGWRIVSPALCLKNRAMLGPPARRLPRDLTFPNRIAFGRFADHTLVCTLDDEHVIRLDGPAGVMWGALGTLGNLEDAADHLATIYDANLDDLHQDLRELCDGLVAAGLLVRTT